MDKYCITAANHENPNNHVASSFFVWFFNPKTSKWAEFGPRSAKDVVGLIESGNSVFTGKLSADRKRLTVGEPVEVELRIAKNKTNYDISEMPEF